MGRVVAIDLGEVRVGIALSDETRTIASPHDVWPRRPEKALIEMLRRLVAEREVDAVVVGHPVRLDGTGGEAAEQAERFARKLGHSLGLPVELFDERLTTVSAEAALIEGNVSREKRKGLRDKVAAAILLDAWLNAGRAAAAGAP